MRWDEPTNRDATARIQTLEKELNAKNAESAEYRFHLERMNATAWWRLAKGLEKLITMPFRLRRKDDSSTLSGITTKTSSSVLGREWILIVCHEASRTGAPILAWNMARLLIKNYNVVVLLMRGGAIRPAFESVASAVISLPDDWRGTNSQAEALVSAVISTYAPKYAIANSAATRSLVPPLERHGVRTIALVHEFACDMWPPGSLSELYDHASSVVFPAKLVADNSLEYYPSLEKKGFSVLAQGSSDLPARQVGESCLEHGAFAEAVRLSEDEDSFLVVGMGTVCYRKGTEFFIQCAQMVLSISPKRKVKFIWVGRPVDGYEPHYPMYLREHIRRAGLEDVVIALDECEDLDPIFEKAGAFFLSSRLDPLPNVSIDAATRGVPVVCFHGASGIAEILESDPSTKDLVVPYLDTFHAAKLIAEMANKPALRESFSRAIRALANSTFDMERYVEKIDRIASNSRDERGECGVPSTPANFIPRN